MVKLASSIIAALSIIATGVSTAMHSAGENINAVLRGRLPPLVIPARGSPVEDPERQPLRSQNETLSVVGTDNNNASRNTEEEGGVASAGSVRSWTSSIFSTSPWANIIRSRSASPVGRNCDSNQDGEENHDNTTPTGSNTSPTRKVAAATKKMASMAVERLTGYVASSTEKERRERDNQQRINNDIDRLDQTFQPTINTPRSNVKSWTEEEQNVEKEFEEYWLKINAEGRPENYVRRQQSKKFYRDMWYRARRITEEDARAVEEGRGGV